MNKKLGQLFFAGLKGPDLTPDEEKFLVEKNIGGVVLFARNYQNLKQLHQLVSRLQGLRKKLPDQAPFFIATDMEGGRIASLGAPFTRWPSMKKLSDLNSTSLAFNMAQSMGEELAAAGFNVDFAPCVDVLTNPKNQLIGDRSAGDNPDQVGKIASALVRGFIKADIIPCAKHFPGHGNTIVDSHEDLPVDNISLKDLTDKLIPPFKKVFKSRLDMVMTAHIKFPAVDADWPATLSEKFLKKMVREDFRYRNLIIADDLEMKALSKNYKREEIPVRALKAGIDLLMYCHLPESCADAYEAVAAAGARKELDMLAVTKSADLVMKIKKEKIKNLDPLPYEEVEKIIGSDENKKIAEAIEQGRIPEGIGEKGGDS